MDTEMQGYAPIPAETKLKDSLAMLQANDDAAISNNAGTAFPTENLVVGMQCFRSDQGVAYTLISTSPVTWSAGLSAAGVIGNQTTGWAAVGTPTLRVVDTGDGTTGGLAIEANQPLLQFIDRTADDRSLRLRLNGGILAFGADDGVTRGTYAENAHLNVYGGTFTLGGAHSHNVGLYLQSKLPTELAVGIAQYGAYITPEFNENATNTGFTVMVQPRVKDAAFTMQNLRGITVSTPSIGANATVQTYDALEAVDATLGGTPTRISAMRLRFNKNAANANKWNLFVDGTAPNHLAGRLSIGTSSDTGTPSLLQIAGLADFQGAFFRGTAGAAWKLESTPEFVSDLVLRRLDLTGATIDTPLFVSKASGTLYTSGEVWVDYRKSRGNNTAAGLGAFLNLVTPANGQGGILGRVDATPRWFLSIPDSDGWFRLHRYDSSGAYMGAAFSVRSDDSQFIAHGGLSSTVILASTYTQGPWVRAQSGSQPGYEYHLPGAAACMTYLNADGSLVFANSNGAGGFTSTRMVSSYSGNLALVGTLSQGSDVRIKTEIETIRGALDKLRAIRGVFYRRLLAPASGEGPPSPGPREMGLVAQEVNEVAPEVVSENAATGYLSVAYGNLVGLVIQAVNELAERVDTLANQVSVAVN